MTHKTRFEGDKTLALISSVGKMATILTDMPKEEAFGENAEVVIGMERAAMDVLGQMFIALYLYAFADGDVDVASAREGLEARYKDGTYKGENEARGMALFDAMIAATKDILAAPERKMPMEEAIKILYRAHSAIVTTTRTVETISDDGKVKTTISESEITDLENVIPFNQTKH